MSDQSSDLQKAYEGEKAMTVERGDVIPGRAGNIVFRLPNDDELIRIEPDGGFYLRGVRVDDADGTQIYEAMQGYADAAKFSHDGWERLCTACQSVLSRSEAVQRLGGIVPLPDAYEVHAYSGASMWRAAIEDVLGQTTALMTAHIFITEEEALAFGRLWISASEELRELLTKIGATGRL